MKKILRNSYANLLWLAILILGYIILYTKSISMGEYAYKTFQAFQDMIIASFPFWLLILLIISQGIIVNSHIEKKQTITVIINLTAAILTIIFWLNISKTINVRQSVYKELDMNWSILQYKLPCLIFVIITDILIVLNTIKIVKNRG